MILFLDAVIPRHHLCYRQNFYTILSMWSRDKEKSSGHYYIMYYGVWRHQQIKQEKRNSNVNYYILNLQVNGRDNFVFLSLTRET